MKSTTMQSPGITESLSATRVVLRQNFVRDMIYLVRLGMRSEADLEVSADF